VGRLFWKFFAFIWLAQLAGIIAISSVFWFQARSDRDFPETVPPPAATVGGHPQPGLPPGPPLGPRREPPPAPRGLPIVPTIVTLLVSLGGALTVAWYVAKPIRFLRAAIGAAAAGNLEVRVGPAMGSRHDELADLGRDFDHMADRLHDSMQSQRRLLHDVSHEMRSPLARLQAAAGLMRLSDGGQAPAMERIEEEIVRIDRLVGDLLKLSRLEAGELAGVEENVDMPELLRGVVADAHFEAQAQGRTVTWETECPGTVLGRPEMLHGAIENVVRNALKHAPQTRDIRVLTTVDAVRSRYTISVIDSGPGVPEPELPRLFSPFFRASAATATGYGLGLAIARRSIEAHGGSISASNRPEGGLSVTIVLPIEPEQINAGADPRRVAAPNFAGGR